MRRAAALTRRAVPHPGGPRHPKTGRQECKLSSRQLVLAMRPVAWKCHSAPYSCRVTTSDVPTLSARKQRIADELDRLEESARDSGTGQFEQAGIWRAVNLIFGLPASVLAAVAGATGLASTSNRVAAGSLALAASAFGAILTVINASQRTNQATAAANAYREIQSAARQARLVDLPWIDEDAARTALAELTARRDEVNKNAEPPNRIAWKRARKSIKVGSQTYAVDTSDQSRGK